MTADASSSWRADVLLLFPPAADPSSPYSSLPYLASALNAVGVSSRCVDLNVRTYNRIFTAGFLSSIDRDSLPLSLRHRLDPVLENPERVRDIYTRRHPSAVDLSWAESALEAVQVALSHMHGRHVWRTKSYGSQAQPSSIAAVVDDVSRGGIFRDILAAEVEALLAHSSPRVVGVSITYPAQLIPSLELAQILRRLCPSSRLVAGGALVENIVRSSSRRAVLETFFDEVVTESGLDAARRVQAMLEPVDIPSLESLAPDAPILAPWDGVPDYAHANPDDYWAPELVPLLVFSVGCTYGYCQFCSIAGLAREEVKTIPPEQAAVTMRQVSKQTGATTFFLGDDNIERSRLLSLAAELEGEGLIWQCETRMDARLCPEDFRLLYAGGCRNLIFGMESASPHVLRRMRKALSPKHYGRLLRQASQAGLGTTCLTFFGFPGEKEEDRELTRRLLRECADSVLLASSGIFGLPLGSPMTKTPGEFGLTNIRPAEDLYDLALEYEYMDRDDRESHRSARVAFEMFTSELDDLQAHQRLLRPFWGTHLPVLLRSYTPTEIKERYGLRLPAADLSELQLNVHWEEESENGVVVGNDQSAAIHLDHSVWRALRAVIDSGHFTLEDALLAGSNFQAMYSRGLLRVLGEGSSQRPRAVVGEQSQG